MKIAVVGAGNWGKNLVRTLHELKCLGSVVETNEKLRDDLKKIYPTVQLASRLEEVLTAETSAVVIGSPAHTHHALAREALAAGKDVFVEKPMTLSAKDSLDLVRLAEDRGRILMVGHLLLYQPAITWIKEFVQSGKLGKLLFLEQRRLGLGKVRSTENVLWSLGVHDVAVVLDLIGSAPISITANGICGLQTNIEDDVHVHMTFPNQVQAHLHNSWLWPEKDRRLTLVGTNGMLVYDENAQKVIFHKKYVTAELVNVSEGEEVVFEGAGQPLTIELQHFIDCIGNRSQPKSSGKSALDVIQVLEDATTQLKVNSKNKQ